MAEFTSLNGYDVKDKKAVRVYESLSDMVLDENLKEGQCVSTLGYYEPNDGGAAAYIITDTSSLTDYQEELENTLYATLIIENNTINVKQLGAYGDGTHDDSDIIQLAIDNIQTNMILYVPSGTYKCDNKLSFSGIQNAILKFDGIIESDDGIIFQNLVRCTIENLKITRKYTKYDYTSLHNTGLEIKNSKYLTFKGVYVSGFEYAYYWHAVNASNSYHELYAVHSFDNLHGWSVLNEGSGFTNEIKVFGGRFSLNTNGVDVSGIADYIVIPEYVSGHNFFGVCLEGEFNKINCAGSYNCFIGCRLEYQDSGLQDIILSGNSNTVYGCYWSEQSGGSSIVNTGLFNKIDTNRQYIIDKVIPENIKTVTSDYSLNRTYNYILCDCTDNNITVTLGPDLKNFLNSIVRIQKIDVSDNYVKLFTTGQTNYDYIGRGALLKNLNDYVDVSWNGTKWVVVDYGKIYDTSLTEQVETNLIEGLEYKQGSNTMIVAEGGTISGSQITNTYCDTTADSADITISISGTSNRVLRLGNYITIDTEPGYFKIIKLDLTQMTATLNRNVTQSLTNKRIKYHYPVKKYLGLIYDKVDTLPGTGNVGDIVFYNTPTPGGYIGAIYTSSGWKNFGQIEA